MFAVFAYWRSAGDKKREQASQVAAWIEEGERQDRLLFRLRNNSDAPIYRVRVMDRYFDIVAEYGELGPGEEQERAWDPITWSALEEVGSEISPQGEYATIRSKVTASLMQDAKNQEVVQLHFRDALGRWWLKTHRGRIKGAGKHTPTPKNSRFESSTIWKIKFIIRFSWREAMEDWRRRQRDGG
ncbi:hypothetical protein ACIHFC_35815 [Streptomyces sp. NPDC052013]|uniref:hypothetical protein n=1 Tax=Streptomyces sp. NPDC052013 TaxID=3365679 RepID=UPI0037D17CD5